jgi:hypothetical protein
VTRAGGRLPTPAAQGEQRQPGAGCASDLPEKDLLDAPNEQLDVWPPPPRHRGRGAAGLSVSAAPQVVAVVSHPNGVHRVHRAGCEELLTLRARPFVYKSLEVATTLWTVLLDRPLTPCKTCLPRGPLDAPLL